MLLYIAAELSRKHASHREVPAPGSMFVNGNAVLIARGEDSDSDEQAAGGWRERRSTAERICGVASDYALVTLDYEEASPPHRQLVRREGRNVLGPLGARTRPVVDEAARGSMIQI